MLLHVVSVTHLPQQPIITQCNNLMDNMMVIHQRCCSTFRSVSLTLLGENTQLVYFWRRRSSTEKIELAGSQTHWESNQTKWTKQTFSEMTKSEHVHQIWWDSSCLWREAAWITDPKHHRADSGGIEVYELSGTSQSYLRSLTSCTAEIWIRRIAKRRHNNKKGR